MVTQLSSVASLATSVRLAEPVDGASSWSATTAKRRAVLSTSGVSRRPLRFRSRASLSTSRSRCVASEGDNSTAPEGLTSSPREQRASSPHTEGA